MTCYRISYLAHGDLESIWRFTTEQWSLSQANYYIDTLFDCLDAVASRSLQGKAIDAIRSGYQKVSCGRHIIFFRFGDDGIAEIIRILHDSMDIERRLADR